MSQRCAEMQLAEWSRQRFDGRGMAEQDGMGAQRKTMFACKACQSLCLTLALKRVTTRALQHSVMQDPALSIKAWLR